MKGMSPMNHLRSTNKTTDASLQPLTETPNDHPRTRFKTPPKALVNGYMTTDGKWVYVRQVDEQHYVWTVAELQQHRYMYRDLEPWNAQWMNFKDVQELCQRHHIHIVGHDEMLKTIKHYVENTDMTTDVRSREQCAMYVEALVFLFGKEGLRKIETLYQSASDQFYSRFFDKTIKPELLNPNK